MTEKQQQLTFDKGITNVPSDAICSDNTLSESIGMVYDNGEHKVIQDPTLLINRSDNILFVHNYNNGKRYIFSDTGKLYWYVQPGAIINELMASTHPQITAIGKTLIVSDDNGLHYFLWNSDSAYKPLSLQLPDLQFEAQVYDIQTALFGSHVTNSQKAEGILGVVEEGGVQRLVILEGQQDSYNNLVVGLYAKNKKAIAAEKGFMEPFFVRAAIELYDGSYTHITNPILLFPTVTKNSYARQWNKNLVLFTHYAKLAVKQLSNYSDYSDVVKDVVVFVSNGVQIYNTSIDQHFNLMTSEEKAACADCVLSDGAVLPCSVFKNFSAVDTSAPAFDCLKKRAQKDIMGDLKEVSVFYKLCSLGIKGTGGYIEVSSLINDRVIENLTTQEQLKYDDYYSHCNLFAKSLYSYNNRLNIANVKRGMFEGFQYFMPLDWDANDKTYDFFVTIKTDTAENVVHHQNLLEAQQKQGIYFYYPDSRAKHVQIYRYVSTEPHYVCVLDADLEEHQGLNGAFYLRELPSSGNVDEIELFSTNALPDYNNGYKENLTNYLLTSEVNNPYVFLAEGYNSIGTGRIIGVSSTTQALSQGQFGQYPLLVFASDGIWAMSVSNTGLYSATHPMSREVALESNPAITQTDGAVFFVSKKGLMVVDGGQVRCVSPQLSGKTEPSDFLIANVGDLQTFLSGCMIAYDYRDSLLWITSPLFRYCYVYSIKNGTFGKYDFGTFSVGNQTYPVSIINVVNDYPDYLICTNVSILSLLNRPNINNDIDAYNGVLISRPMKLENAFALKSLMHVNHLYSFEEDSVINLRIFGSNNLRNWIELSSLRGIPWLYYRFRYDFSNMKATDRFSGTIAVTQERRTSKPRTCLSALNSNVQYLITTSFDNDPEGMVIPKNQQTLTILFDAKFYKKIGDGQPEAINCYWAIWAQLKNGTFSLLQDGYDDENTQKNLTLTTDMDAIVVGMNVNNAPTPASSQAAKRFKVTKIPDDATVYTYSVGSNVSTIVIPAGETSVEKQVMGYALRTANGNTEDFACYIKLWRLTDDVYTKIAGNTVPSYSAGVYDVFEQTDSAVVIAISDTEMSDTYGSDTYLATKSIQIESSPGPGPGPEPTYSFSTLLGSFNDVLESRGFDRITEFSAPYTYAYLLSGYNMAIDEWEDADSDLFKTTTYPELYDGTDYRGSNTDYNGVAKNSMTSWLMAMQLAELVPSSAASGVFTNNQTEIFKYAYNCVAPNNDGKTIPLYGGFDIHSDPMIARLAAGAVYEKIHSGKTFEQMEVLRREVFRDNNNHWINAYNWDGLGYTHTEVKNSSDQRIGYTMNSLGYLVNTSLFLPSTPGQRVSGTYAANQPLPSSQGQSAALFDSDDNYLVDANINTFMVNNYKMMAQTPLSTWNSYSSSKKNRLIQAMAVPRNTKMYMFGSPINVSLVLDNGQLPVVDGYNRYEFEESSSSTGLVIDGPFSDLANRGLWRYVTVDLSGTFEQIMARIDAARTDQEKYIRAILDIFDNCRFPTYDANLGRRRPGCGNTILASEYNPTHGADENELYNIDISVLVADDNYDSTTWPTEDGFAKDRPNAYPSGHSSQIWGMAMLLGQMKPENLVTWMRKAYEYSVNRSVGRFHWNSDLIYGRLFSTMMAPIINAMNGTNPSTNKTFQESFTDLSNSVSGIMVNLRIVSEVNAYSTGEIKFYVDNHNGILANLPNASPSSNVYSFPQGYDNTFSDVECTGNGFDVSTLLNTALDGDVVVYAFDGTTHNSSMVTATISGEGGVFVNGGTYTITITAYNPNP